MMLLTRQVKKKKQVRLNLTIRQIHDLDYGFYLVKLIFLLYDKK